MNASDLIIIYLACGAPFAVYFYLQNRQRLYLRQLIFKTVLNFIFWVPFSLQFLFLRIFLNQNRSSQAAPETYIDESLESVQKQLEQVAAQIPAVNFYEFKEILNRYIGLSLSILPKNMSPTESEREIFQFSESANHEIGSICIHRRNRERLLFHQRLAGADFAAAIFELSKEHRNPEKLINLSAELASLLSDSQTIERLQSFFTGSLQIAPVSNVSHAENKIWNSPPLKLSNHEQISINMTPLSRTNLPLKD